MDDDRAENPLPAGMTGRGLRGRRMAQLELVIAIVPGVLVGALLLSAPNFTPPMFVEDPIPMREIAIGVGILGYVVGLATMIRIYRSDREDHPSNWRSRRF
jgi:hypothetical protein